MICSACNNTLEVGEDRLCCMRCDKLYHLICTGLKNPNDIADYWICPECQCAAKKGGDNSFTHVGSSQDPNVTLRKKTIVKNPIQYNENNSLIAEMSALRSEMSVLKELLTKALSLVSSHEEKLQNYAVQVEQLNNRLEKYDNSSLNTECTAQGQPYCMAVSKVIDPNIRKQNVNQTKKPGIVQAESSNSFPKTTRPPELNNTSVTREESTPSAVQNNNDNSETGWNLVKRRNSRRPTSLHGSGDPDVIKLRAVEIRKYLHLWNMASGIDEVRQYVNQLCPTNTNTVEELTPRGDYKSYKVGIAAEYWDRCYSIDVWPINAKIKPWINYRKQVRTTNSSNAVSGTSNVSQQQSFRGTPTPQSQN